MEARQFDCIKLSKLLIQQTVNISSCWPKLRHLTVLEMLLTYDHRVLEDWQRFLDGFSRHLGFQRVSSPDNL